MNQPSPCPDIATHQDVVHIVNTFYGHVQHDALIGPIFNSIIQERWPEHLEKMYRFWQTVLLEEYTYQGSPFPPHAKLPIQKEHFTRWLELFTATVDAHFGGPNADKAKWQAEKMASLFLSKIEYYRDNNISEILQ